MHSAVHSLNGASILSWDFFRGNLFNESRQGITQNNHKGQTTQSHLSPGIHPPIRYIGQKMGVIRPAPPPKPDSTRSRRIEAEVARLSDAEPRAGLRICLTTQSELDRRRRPSGL